MVPAPCPVEYYGPITKVSITTVITGATFTSFTTVITCNPFTKVTFTTVITVTTFIKCKPVIKITRGEKIKKYVSGL